VCCLFSYKRILIVISHSQDFLNGICTNIIHMHLRKLRYYGVSYIGASQLCLFLSLEEVWEMGHLYSAM